VDNTIFVQGMQIYPQPVAFSCGRIARATHPAVRLEAILKCAETATRYLTALAISSWAARADPAAPVPGAFSQLDGNLSFGKFLTVVQRVATTKSDHPLRAALRAGFQPTKGQPRGPADAALVDLLETRNRLGHALQSMDEAQAQLEFAKNAPDARLAAALAALDPILSMPLFLVQQQSLANKIITGRRLLLMGESADPIPEEVALSEGLDQPRALYVGVPEGALRLAPFLIWDLAENKGNYRIYFIHAVAPDALKYVTVTGDERTHSDDRVPLCQAYLSGVPVPLESGGLRDGRSFLAEWQALRAQRIGVVEQPIPWTDLDPDAVQWFAQRLGAEPGEAAARQAIHNRLLDGRTRLSPDEIRQLTLLLGREPVVRQALGRAVVDCRARVSGQGRWDERVECTTNILSALREAVEFFGRHVGVQGLSLDGLKQTQGTADYVAIREALVNLFIHQDYNDRSTAGQIEHTPERTQFFNAGKALVSPAALVDGGKSQSRNPLISRALRLIGFAELAGSGLREVHTVWRNAHRRPPAIESNEDANTFTLTLDWRPRPEEVDPFWLNQIGVKLTPAQAQALQLAADPAGTSVEEIASALGLLYEDAQALARYLKTQVLVHEVQGRLHLTDHLKALVAPPAPQEHGDAEL